ncbi:MAG TPA: bifunctional UDP-N-acetylglucosamine diphosphorylase/glucosamine-1-phosphate N-acetyltransferase GlmU [Solirubrobacterales bacterium]|nr:bifunctional UDP-N-acetylglucosamine diphosphorylase/glucosamine-1-phosphate N-acetyltransferase GlmU [Solirubrobacterales bacterium]
MAAGKGTRMRSSLPKMLHPVCGRAMVAWPILAAREAGAGRVAAIVSPGIDLTPGLPEGVETVEQPEPDGTGGAIRAAAELIAGSETVLVLSGDVPLLSAATIAGLLEAHAASPAAATMLTIELDEPGSYGRVVRLDSGEVEQVVEAKAAGDADPEQLAIREINAGTYVFDAAPLAAALAGISNDNAQGEYYLPDVFPALRAAGHSVAAHRADDLAVTMGVNNRADLAAVEAEARRRLLEAHMVAGVTVVDPGSTWVDAGVEIGADARIEPGTSLRGATSVGAHAVVGPLTTLVDSAVGIESSVIHSYLVECEVQDGCSVGPFAYLRPGAVLDAGAKAGTFVEVKNSHVGKGAKIPHLAYVGDADVGPGANLGAGTITANYDGFRKNRTVIGRDVRIGVDTMLIAPVEVGDSAYTGAGAVIKDDVPEGALAVSENAQRNIDGYAADKAAKMREEQSP